VGSIGDDKGQILNPIRDQSSGQSFGRGAREDLVFRFDPTPTRGGA